MIRAQGGDPDAPLPTARETHVVPAPADGVLVRLDAYAVGVAAWRLGAGRARKEDPVQAGAGVEHARQAGRTRSVAASRCSRCTPTSPARFADAEAALAEAVVIAPAGSRPDRPAPVVLDRVG